MRVFIKRQKSSVDAQAEVDLISKKVTVLKGSVVSEHIAYSEKFRGAKSIEKYREGVLEGNILKKNIEFKSASTAANFVTGASTNGMIAWKDSNGKTLKAILSEMGDTNE